ncbi:MAG: RNase adapter protein RapZ [Thermosipho sp. (in: thermotogales)]|nr:RNase adapter protein RapZ [Thermosipho sp. (in: thermotogales)]MDN5324894.1 RNase adapter protein RapZ [Thermosipho sp. (in: thermotogales)]
MSGAGKSTALGLLEDLGFYCIDNFPPALIDKLLPVLSINIENLALVIDVRSGELDKLESVVKSLKEKYNKVLQIIFLTAKKEILINRFALTRRNHPLLKEKFSLEKAIDEEKKYLSPILEISDVVIDTSNLNPHQLREKLKKILEGLTYRFSLRIVSFGFKYGIPLDVDFVFDVRFFPNPFYVRDLKNKTGKDKEVKEFMYNTEGVETFMEFLEKIIDFSIKRYENEGRMELNIGIGCTGGQHRSVFFAEELGKKFSEKYNVNIEHRDVK